MAGTLPARNASTVYTRKRSRILYEISALLVVVLILSGLATFFLVRRSQERLIDKSVDKLLESCAENVSSSYDYIIRDTMPELMRVTSEEGTEVIAQKILTQEMSHSQEFTSGMLRGMVDQDLLGMEMNMVVFMSYARFPLPEPLLFASSEEGLVYDWRVPDDIAEAIDAGKEYIFRKDGIPELGLEGEYLVITKRIEDPDYGYVAGYVGVKPIGEQIAAINEYYDNERSSISWVLGLVVGVSILAVVIITFLVLSYLIRTRITEPIDELSMSAAEVMEGNLDVDIEVHEKGDLAGLESAFKEMVESFRRMITQASAQG